MRATSNFTEEPGVQYVDVIDQAIAGEIEPEDYRDAADKEQTGEPDDDSD